MPRPRSPDGEAVHRRVELGVGRRPAVVDDGGLVRRGAGVVSERVQRDPPVGQARGDQGATRSRRLSQRSRTSRASCIQVPGPRCSAGTSRLSSGRSSSGRPTRCHSTTSRCGPAPTRGVNAGDELEDVDAVLRGAGEGLHVEGPGPLEVGAEPPRVRPRRVLHEEGQLRAVHLVAGRRHLGQVEVAERREGGGHEHLGDRVVATARRARSTTSWRSPPRTRSSWRTRSSAERTPTIDTNVYDGPVPWACSRLHSSRTPSSPASRHPSRRRSANASASRPATLCVSWTTSTGRDPMPDAKLAHLRAHGATRRANFVLDGGVSERDHWFEAARRPPRRGLPPLLLHQGHRAGGRLPRRRARARARACGCSTSAAARAATPTPSAGGASRSHGVDISAAVRRPGRGATPRPASTFERLDARALPFDGEFDAAISLCQGAFGLTGGAAAAPGSTATAPCSTAWPGPLRPGGRLACQRLLAPTSRSATSRTTTASTPTRA